MTSALPTYFDKLIQNVKLQDAQREEARKGHTTLQERIESDEDLRPIVVATFLQGSYRRGTSVKPKNGQRADVDVVVVTNLAKDQYPDPEPVFTEYFLPFVERYYKDHYDPNQDHSIGINLSAVDLDLVPTTAPSVELRKMVESDAVRSQASLDELGVGDWRLNESWMSPARRPTLAEASSRLLAKVMRDPEWQSEPLWIPNREKDAWEQTDPLEQLRQTSAKNARCNGHFLDVVRAIRWWRRLNPNPKYPKGYPVEHLVWVSCPNGVSSTAEGIVAALEDIRDRYAIDARIGRVPVVPDHGVPQHNVLERLTAQDFQDLHKLITQAAGLARRAFDADGKAGVPLWRELFGEDFPDDPDKGPGGYVRASGPSSAVQTRFG